jgi:ubiquitin fusion degradation protein 1
MQGGNDQRSIMQFAIRNTRLSLVVYAGVKDFTARPGQIILPYWMMQFLQISEGERVTVTLSSEGGLRTATRATFRPEDKDFAELPNTRVILEKALREHPCLTQGTVIPVPFNDRVYPLRVLKLEPDKVVSAFRADVTTDFAPHASEFNHDWTADGADSDSSSDTELVQANLPKTLKDTQITLTQPLRSTFAKREEERRTRPPPVGVTLFQAGQPIAPPKAPEAKRKTTPDAFKGPGKVIKRKKTAEETPVKAEVPKAEPESPRADAFRGRPKTLKDQVGAVTPEDTEKPRPTSAFVGPSRTLGKPPEPKTPEVVPKPKPAEATKPEEPPKTAFQGTGRKLNRR